jgi:hypothetical protein
LAALARWSRRVGKILVFVLLCVAALAFLEGVASLILVLQAARQHLGRPVAERYHTRYDPEIGWVNRPNVRLADFYGPGADLNTNSRGFRGRREVTDGPLTGRRRIVCSGDSFTFGFGVGDEKSWCHLLEVLDPKRESVNMGQGGYGVDQAWLWYRRDARTLAHEIQVFAFIAEDLQRMTSGYFNGYGKPQLRLESGELQVENVPVPRGAYRLPWLTHNRDLVLQLRSVRLLGEILPRFRSASVDAAPAVAAVPLAFAVFEDLARLNQDKGSRLVVVYLPEKSDYFEDPPDNLKSLLAAGMAQRGLTYLDLTEEIRKLPVTEAERLFLQRGSGGVFAAAPGHYSEEGHNFIARALDRRLRVLFPAESRASN